MQEKSLLLKLTGELPLFRIIDFLIENKGLDLTKKDIIEGSRISRASLFNYWKILEYYNVVKVNRKFGKTKLYILNTESPITKNILNLERSLISEAMNRALERKVEIAA